MHAGMDFEGLGGQGNIWCVKKQNAGRYELGERTGAEYFRFCEHQ